MATADASLGATAPAKGSWWQRVRRFVPFLGPAFLVSVGYMDPGNWATNILAGSAYGYTLLWVLLMSNVMALVLQALSAKLGVATGLTLAQAVRANTSRPTSIFLWLTAEAAAIATDLAEFLGAALGFYLLLGVPLLAAALLTGVIVFAILALHRFGHRKVEIAIMALVAIVGIAYVYEVFITKPAWLDVGRGTLVPGFGGAGAILAAVGMIGATVMPHNVFLGSHVVQARRQEATSDLSRRQVYKYAVIDLIVALNIAWLINSAMVIMSAAAFRGQGVDRIEVAHATLGPLFGGASAFAFAIALLAAGLSSSVTGTLAGQSIMEGFIGFRMSLWLRRSITMIPAIVAIAFFGDNSFQILIWSQVTLSLQLPFTIVPLIWLTSKKSVMGDYANKPWVTAVALLFAMVILAFNGYLLWSLWST
jgi:manganese transport protein